MRTVLFFSALFCICFGHGQQPEIYTTSKEGARNFDKSIGNDFIEMKQPLETQTCIFVMPEAKRQTILGFGGAITDASAEVYTKLTPENQEKLLQAYFDKDKGIGYNVIRTSIHSCDFSSGSYTYIDEGDASLESFSIDHDRQYKLPLIKKAMAEIGQQAVFYASPWSPPAFMKDNKNMLRGGKLLPEYYQSWANYYVRFIEEYEKEGIPVWGLTIQNEPMAVQRWESCIYTAEEERDFLKNHLGPTLAKNGMEDKKIVVWDHNRDLITQRATTILDDPEAARYTWGVGYHWYENWSGGENMHENLDVIQQLYPDINLLFTEGCVEKFDAGKYQFWDNGERYGRNMINDFNRGVVGWTDWNILLDQNGGPNHVGNFCFAPIHGNTETGELIFTPSYYFIGHFSKFVKKNARAVLSATSRSQLLSTSFKNPDGTMVTVVLNETDESTTYFLCIGDRSSEITIAPRAIQTLIYTLPN